MITVRILVGMNKGTKGVTLDVRKSGFVVRMVFTKTEDLQLEMGDAIKCVVGNAFAMINPGTAAGGYVLTTTPTPTANGKELTVLRINEETVRSISRGSIQFSSDIGATNTSAEAATR